VTHHINVYLSSHEVCVLVFFFSSRRRHTRCLSDWSSDVCSSDLVQQFGSPEAAAAAYNAGEDRIAAWKAERNYEEIPELVESIRSEERRVGKECRWRWWPQHRKEI